MKQEDRELLLKDLCARLSYGVSIHTTLYGAVSLNETMIRNFRTGIEDALTPYLRPMSSMTEDEKRRFYDICTELASDKCHFILEGFIDSNFMLEKFDYLNSIHVDYRGLIPKGLAIEVTKENNPYESSIETT